MLSDQNAQTPTSSDREAVQSAASLTRTLSSLQNDLAVLDHDLMRLATKGEDIPENLAAKYLDMQTIFKEMDSADQLLGLVEGRCDELNDRLDELLSALAEEDELPHNTGSDSHNTASETDSTHRHDSEDARL